MSTELAFLKERLEHATAGLRSVTTKRMFGCDAFFRDGNMFALVWKHGRIGVKLPNAASHASLSAVAGVEPWSPGGKMVMGSWLLVPDAWNDDENALQPWVRVAYGEATGEGKKKAAAKKPAATKPAVKKPAAKKPAAKKRAVRK